MSDYTKGPWEIEPHESWSSMLGRYVVDAGCYDKIGPLEVGVTYADDVWLEVSESDACLIAAAPDLLEALKDARAKVYTSLTLSGTAHEYAEIACAKFDAAIAKAEGQP